MVEQVVKYFFSQNPFPVSEFAYCDRKCVKFDPKSIFFVFLVSYSTWIYSFWSAKIQIK